MSDQLHPTQPKESVLSEDSCTEDWDQSLVSEQGALPDHPPASENASKNLTRPGPTPRNSVVFPAAADGDTTPSRSLIKMSKHARGKGKRTLSELLKLHAEKGTDCRLSPDEATRLGDVLGQWINASSSPYEGEDDFFEPRDDIGLPPKRALNFEQRPRGRSESAGSRP